MAPVFAAGTLGRESLFSTAPVERVIQLITYTYYRKSIALSRLLSSRSIERWAIFLIPDWSREVVPWYRLKN